MSKLAISLCLLLLIVGNAEVIQGQDFNLVFHLNTSRSVNAFETRAFEHYMDEKDVILVFVKSYECLQCMEDRWYLHKTIYNFLLRKEVFLVCSCTLQFFVFELTYGDNPEFDKEFGTKSDVETPQYLLFRNGDRKPLYHYKSEDLVRSFDLILLTDRLTGLPRSLILNIILTWWSS